MIESYESVEPNVTKSAEKLYTARLLLVVNSIFFGDAKKRKFGFRSFFSRALCFSLLGEVSVRTACTYFLESSIMINCDASFVESFVLIHQVTNEEIYFPNENPRNRSQLRSCHDGSQRTTVAWDASQRLSAVREMKMEKIFESNSGRRKGDFGFEKKRNKAFVAWNFFGCTVGDQLIWVVSGTKFIIKKLQLKAHRFIKFLKCK